MHQEPVVEQLISETSIPFDSRRFRASLTVYYREYTEYAGSNP